MNAHHNPQKLNDLEEQVQYELDELLSRICEGGLINTEKMQEEFRLLLRSQILHERSRLEINVKASDERCSTCEDCEFIYTYLHNIRRPSSPSTKRGATAKAWLMPQGVFSIEDFRRCNKVTLNSAKAKLHSLKQKNVVVLNSRVRAGATNHVFYELNRSVPLPEEITIIPHESQKAPN